ncbi:MAG: SDR family NAD(P)-dependent oxidoreductase [Myxococcaceae bacterium]|jgi:NAD(P)-dependent dehydrogenase (short-subunit alcohol dehydrogenase family)|nr:SDR family NAD(P)-dependent oxidoreductase [Myxococcaceae bacterium]MCA3015424.1 SDR family NAD(P)-dependent oxidoreductase [Myxococcaceae bacterium]
MRTSEQRWFITGASRGLGRAIADEALRRGHRVAVTARDVAALTGFVPADRVLALALDVRDRDAVFRAVDAAAAHLGGLDVVVNNAGYGLFGPLESIVEAELDEQVDTNVYGPLRVCQAAVPHLRRGGGGRILQMSSIAGFVGSPGSGPYNLSKFALEGLSEAIAQELAPENVFVSLVEPGGFRTDFAEARSVRFSSGGTPEQLAAVRQRLASFSGRQMGDPKEAARVIVDCAALDDPPFRLILGEDAAQRFQTKVDFLQDELEAFAALSKTKPLAGSAPLGLAPFTRPWRK